MDSETELRKWCVEKALASGAIFKDVAKVSREIFEFVSAQDIEVWGVTDEISLPGKIEYPAHEESRPEAVYRATVVLDPPKATDEDGDMGITIADGSISLDSEPIITPGIRKNPLGTGELSNEDNLADDDKPLPPAAPAKPFIP